ncbi:MAG TPA: hypothetical protein VEC16_06565 [Alphaproteobacteria bacterium]|nr:hypothetical protein [Alphaproteobacteria bacterium]
MNKSKLIKKLSSIRRKGTSEIIFIAMAAVIIVITIFAAFQ